MDIDKIKLKLSEIGNKKLTGIDLLNILNLCDGTEDENIDVDYTEMINFLSDYSTDFNKLTESQLIDYCIKYTNKLNYLFEKEGVILKTFFSFQKHKEIVDIIKTNAKFLERFKD